MLKQGDNVVVKGTLASQCGDTSWVMQIEHSDLSLVCEARFISPQVDYPFMLNDRPLKINDKVMITVKANLWESVVIEMLQMDATAWCATVRWADGNKEEGVLPEELTWPNHPLKEVM